MQRFSAPNCHCFRNLSQYRLKKGQNIQFLSNKGVHGAVVHLTDFHAWNLHGKVKYISQTSENSLVPYLKTGHDSIHMYFLKSVYIYNGIDYVTLNLFNATDISFICLLTCVDNKPLKRCKIIVARLLEQFEDAYRSNYISIGMAILNTDLFYLWLFS